MMWCWKNKKNTKKRIQPSHVAENTEDHYDSSSSWMNDYWITEVISDPDNNNNTNKQSLLSFRFGWCWFAMFTCIATSTIVIVLVNKYEKIL